MVPLLRERAKSVNRNVSVAVVLAKTEDEAWFLGALESIVGHGQVLPPLDPEAVRGAKERLAELTGQS